ncbi:MAG: CMP/dCMP deaminase zinc-binding [Magnetococcales bacterium]|nr:CMP/dCMP deaminase zinc-binding [Magnetococcales bacterium]
MAYALMEAEKSYNEGGLPIGSLMFDHELNKHISSGHNRRIQDGDPIAHGEMDCIRKAGRRHRYNTVTLYSTLSPCMMCSGTIVQFGIPRVVIGENINFRGNIAFLEKHDVKVTLLNDEMCIKLMEKFIRENPKLWDEDVSGRDHVWNV